MSLPDPSPLTLAVREFIVRVGVEAAHARFTEAPATGPKPLSLERVRRVAEGKDEPTYRMAEAVWPFSLPASASVTASALPAPIEGFDELSRAVTSGGLQQPVQPMPQPVALQPWATPVPTYEAVETQPWMRNA